MSVYTAMVHTNTFRHQGALLTSTKCLAQESIMNNLSYPWYWNSQPLVEISLQLLSAVKKIHTVINDTVTIMNYVQRRKKAINME